MTDRAEWEARYRERPAGSRPPEPFLVAQRDRLPTIGRALDVGGGDGRNAVWLAGHGLDVTIVDIAQEALDRAEALAASLGLRLTTVRADLDVDPVPDGPWDVMVCTFYLNRRVLAAAPALLAPGGHLVVVHPTRSNLERNAHPSARWLLDDGELPGLVGLPVVAHAEGWTPHGQHLAHLIARRPRHGG